MLRKFQKKSRITIVMSLITNIDLLFRLYIIVVAKSWFDRLFGTCHCRVSRPVFAEPGLEHVTVWSYVRSVGEVDNVAL